MTRPPAVSKDEVLALYEERSREAEEHRKMMSSHDTWQNRFLEAASLIPWGGVRRWLDLGCGTARFFERVVADRLAPDLEECLGIDAIENTLRTAAAKGWPDRPRMRFERRDIEDIGQLAEGAFDLVTMVGVVYQCGIDPAVAVASAASQLGPGGTLLVTTENDRFSGFVAHPHGWYPSREEFEEMLRRNLPDAAVTVQYTNPLWRQRAAGLPAADSAAFKETFFLARRGAR